LAEPLRLHFEPRGQLPQAQARLLIQQPTVLLGAAQKHLNQGQPRGSDALVPWRRALGERESALKRSVCQERRGANSDAHHIGPVVYRLEVQIREDCRVDFSCALVPSSIARIPVGRRQQ
jgi:hypothetical protein